MEVIMEVNRKGLLVKKRGGITIYHYTINCSLTATVLIHKKTKRTGLLKRFVSPPSS